MQKKKKMPKQAKAQISYKISNRLQFNSSSFFLKTQTVLHWHSFFQDVPHVQKTFKYINTDTYIFCGP